MNDPRTSKPVKENQSIHTLFLPKWYPNINDFLDGNFIENHADAIAKYCRVTVLFITSTERIKEKTYRLEVKEEHGKTVIRVYYRKVKTRLPGIAPLMKAFRYLRAFRMGYRWMMHNLPRPDIVHVHVLTRPAIPALWLKWRLKIPMVITEHWSGYKPERGEYRGMVKKLFTRLAVNHANAITTVTDDLKKAMRNAGLPGNYTVIPNSVNTAVFRPGKPYRRMNNRFLHISTLEDRIKNVSGILKAVRQLVDQGEKPQLVILGDGKDRLRQENLARTLGLYDKYVIFMGNQPREAVVAQMQQANALVMFSNVENLPCVILEAWACGLPVITTPAGGIPEVFHENLGILVPFHDVSRLAQAMDAIIKGRITFDRSLIRQYAVDKFSEETIGIQFFELYKALINSNRHG